MKLYNDDCLNVLKTIPDNSIDLIITDPPYRVISGGNKSVEAPKGILSNNDGKIFIHNDTHVSRWMPELYRVLKNNSDCYIMTNFINLYDYMTFAKQCGFKFHNLLVWEKNNALPNRWYMKNCEYTLYLYKGKAKSINNPSCMTVHKFNNIIGNKSHPTEKPVDLISMYVTNSSNETDVILDPFMGTGSCGEACVVNNRDFIGIEIDKEYYDIAYSRINVTIDDNPHTTNEHKKENNCKINRKTLF